MDYSYAELIDLQMMVRLKISKCGRQHIISKLLIGIAFVLTIVALTYWLTNGFRWNGKKCFIINENLISDLKLLEDIMVSEKKPQPGNSVFFHETSCSNGIVKLNAR